MTERSTQQSLPDLLGERRLELGLPEPAGSWQPMRPLLLRGPRSRRAGGGARRPGRAGVGSDRALRVRAGSVLPAALLVEDVCTVEA